MKININPNLNFTATKQNYDEAYVKKLTDGLCTYESSKVNVAEIDFNGDLDFKALNDLKTSWSEAHFIDGVYAEAKKLHNKSWYNDGTKKIFVLTTQNSDFQNLAPEKVLSICQLSGIYDKEAEVRYIETNPNYLCQPFPEYKCNGRTLMKFLQSKYDCLVLSAVEDSYVHSFYESLGFKLVDPIRGIFKWIKNYRNL